MPPYQDDRAVRHALAAYQAPDHRQSLWELWITVLPLGILWSLAGKGLAHGQWWVLLLALPAGAFLMRLFLIQHDCGHRSWFASARANDWTGRVLGVLTMTPYDYWRRTHAIHHATSGDLDRRSLGGVETLTVEEYRDLPRLKRAAYRLYRNPLVILGLGPAYLFALQHRIPVGLMKDPAAWRSVIGNSLGLAVLIGFEVALAGTPAVLLFHLAMVVVAATIGVWLFYVQHQFEGASWRRHEEWTALDAALQGSSHLAMPAPLRWITANIGAHHIHHAAARIPFYRLPDVLRDHPALSGKRVDLAGGWRAMGLTLWDEHNGQLVGFRTAKAGAYPAFAAVKTAS
ncbi:MAG: fatty acid desaturase [Caulobacteraceae bacterium]|nr:MAG: fatty acid desaturase [Caulobacteraceae bacterium]